jgi:hypothetical protein
MVRAVLDWTAPRLDTAVAVARNLVLSLTVLYLCLSCPPVCLLQCKCDVHNVVQGLACPPSDSRHH